MKSAYDILIRPVISEQSMEQNDIKKYVFEVAKSANKIEIAKAVEEAFGVEVDKVNTLMVRGREKRVGSNPKGYTSSWKKAIVKLKPKSKTIEFFEGMV